MPKNQVTTQREEPPGNSFGISLENGNWRLEYNGRESPEFCDNTGESWPRKEIIRTLRTMVETHIPKWQNALEKAEPPREQTNRKATGYI